MLRRILCCIGIHSWVYKKDNPEFRTPNMKFNLNVTYKTCRVCYHKLFRLERSKNWLPGKLDKLELRDKKITDLLDI